MRSINRYDCKREYQALYIYTLYIFQVYFCAVTG